MKLKVVALAAVVFVCPAFAQIAWSAEEDVVAYRKNNMTILKGHMGSLVALVKGQVSYEGHAAIHATGLAEAARMSPHAFKDKALTGKTTVKETVWSDPDAFSKEMKAFIVQADALKKAALDQDKSAMQVALGKVGKSCKSCHDAFREKK